MNQFQVFGATSSGHFTNHGQLIVAQFDNNGEQISPIGTFTVNGDLVNNGSIALRYDANDPTYPNNPGVSNGLVNVTGTATLASNSNFVLAPVSETGGLAQTGDQLTIMTTGGGVTDMGTEILSPSPFLNWTGSVSGNNYIATALRRAYTTQANTPNQFQVATGLDALAASPIAPGSPSANLLFGLDTLTVPQFQNALEQLSPERYNIVNLVHQRTTQGVVNTQNNYLAGRRMGVPVNQSADTSGLGMMFASSQLDPMMIALAMDEEQTQRIADEGYLPDTNYNVWAKGFYMRSSASTEFDTRTGYSANTGGGIIGADTRIANNLLVGLSFAFTATLVDYDGAGGNADIYGYRFGPYLSWEPIERLFIDFSVSYAFSQIDSERTTTNGMNTVTASADYNGHDVSVYLGAEYDVVPDRHWYVAPLIGMNYIWFHQEAFTETGAGGGNLSVDAQDTNSLDLRVGGRFAWMGKVSDSFYVVPEAVVAYRRELLAQNNSGITARFVNAGGGFEIARGPVDENGIELGAGVSFLIDNNLSFFANYSGVFYSGSDVNHFVGAGLSWGF